MRIIFVHIAHVVMCAIYLVLRDVAEVLFVPGTGEGLSEAVVEVCVELGAKSLSKS